MATSGSVTYSATTSELLSSAYELARVKDTSESLTSAQTSTGIASLNKIIKYLQKMGMPLWAIKKDTITLVQSSQSYTCGPTGTGLLERPLRILQAFYRDGTNDIQVELISRQEYNELGDKSVEGIPTQIYYDPQLNEGVVYVYNPADANSAGNSLYLIYQRPFEDILSVSNEFDFPNEWTMTIEYMLAADLAFRNGIRQGRISQLEAKARDLLDEVMWWDVEDTSLQIVPDTQGHAG